MSVPYCSLSYRWATPSKWALMKDGRKSAIKLYDTEAEELSTQARGQNVVCAERPESSTAVRVLQRSSVVQPVSGGSR